MEGLTEMKILLICPARLAKNLRVDTEQRQPSRKRGVDGKNKVRYTIRLASKETTKLTGSALRLIPMFFDSVRR
ncbi:hypothetical protein XpopCFBP1817_18500 [Xanthomonas populi]|uniref:Uncharacterized protein n=1 Tax=Xanthomonas populi TaxID=53414 RepID=A0A2S7EAK7_9XANT|nr:hypothetical protein XpopCFBP1817_18500 [Xanthomonas populi]